MMDFQSSTKTSVKTILDQLDAICRSVELKSKPQLCRLLKYLVDETLAGREEHLKGYKIGVEVFEKDTDFNPDLDPLVRIHAGRLRRSLKMYYLDKGKNDPIIIEIPKGQYVPNFKLNSSFPEEQTNILRNQSNPFNRPAIAILPFKNLSGDSSKDYFALGFSEELSVELTKFEDITVFESIPFSNELVSETDRYHYILKKGVRFIIEGSVHLTDDQVKVLARLTDLNKTEQVWAQRYRRDLSAASLIEIQENIVADIAGIVGSEYGIILQQLSVDLSHLKSEHLQTFQAISKYYYFEANQTPEASIEAFQCLERAIENDPQSGIALAMLASLYGNRYMLDLDGAEEAYIKMNKLADKAVQLEPNSLTVNVICAWRFFANNHKERFFELVERCLSRNPNPSMRLGSLGFYLSLFGEWEQGKMILDKVMHTNISFPLYYYGGTMLYYYRSNDYKRALAEVIHYNIPALFWGPLLRVAVLGQLNKRSEARQHIDHLLALKPDFEEKARYLISRFVKEETLVTHVLEGLQKAGLKTNDG
jgi:adenylate cyclase